VWQLVHIFSSQKVGNKNAGETTWLAGGNFFDVIHYEGRYDAQALSLFCIGKNTCKPVPQPDLAGMNGQVRDIKWLKTKDNLKVLLVARNNESLIVLQVEK